MGNDEGAQNTGVGDDDALIGSDVLTEGMSEV